MVLCAEELFCKGRLVSTFGCLVSMVSRSRQASSSCVGDGEEDEGVDELVISSVGSPSLRERERERERDKESERR